MVGIMKNGGRHSCSHIASVYSKLDDSDEEISILSRQTKATGISHSSLRVEACSSLPKLVFLVAVRCRLHRSCRNAMR
jgi:hypothetical protein